MIAVFVMFGVGLTVAVVLGARRDRQVEADVQREARRRLHWPERRDRQKGS